MVEQVHQHSSNDTNEYDKQKKHGNFWPLKVDNVMFQYEKLKYF